jgi:Mg-chelatase subunit ChlD
MPKRRDSSPFNLALLDIITGALGAVIILYVAVPKANPLEDKIEEIQKSVEQKEENIKELKAELEQLKVLRASAEKAILENEELKNQITETKVEEKEEEKKKDNDGQTLDIGFKFKGRSIVFAIDTSRSMLDEDRMSQVKAGLKMLLLSMPKGYAIDIVQFPNGRRTAYRPLFNQLKPLGIEAKYDAMDFIYSMKPLGATPIRDTLNYVFQNYKDITDIVLLTDGEPSIHESPIKDDIYDLLSHISKLNGIRKIQINAIGVGQEVLKDKTGNAYQFLKLLSEQHGGFFVGF